jgi:hypothetical protein
MTVSKWIMAPSGELEIGIETLPLAPSKTEVTAN